MPLRGLYPLFLVLICCSVCLTVLLTLDVGASPSLLCLLLSLLCVMARVKVVSQSAQAAPAASTCPESSPTSPHRRRRSTRGSRPHPYMTSTSSSSYASTSPSPNQQQLTPDSTTASPTSTSYYATPDTAFAAPLQPNEPPSLATTEPVDPLESDDAATFPALCDGRYRLLRTLQTSLFGCVKSAVVVATGQRVCLKISCLRRAALGVTVNGVKVEEDVHREGQLLQYLHSTAAADEKGRCGIVEFVEELRDQQFYYLVLGDAGCDLFVHLRQLPILDSRSQLQHIECVSSVAEDAARDIFRQLIDAVQFCHRHHVAINDLSLENICIDSTGRVRLIDLGLATLHPLSPYTAVRQPPRPPASASRVAPHRPLLPRAATTRGRSRCLASCTIWRPSASTGGRTARTPRTATRAPWCSSRLSAAARPTAAPCAATTGTT